MSDAKKIPERVWCFRVSTPEGWKNVWTEGMPPTTAEARDYVRADLYAAAAAEERARIVAWLHTLAQTASADWSPAFEGAAYAIERGDHADGKP